MISVPTVRHSLCDESDLINHIASQVLDIDNLMATALSDDALAEHVRVIADRWGVTCKPLQALAAIMRQTAALMAVPKGGST